MKLSKRLQALAEAIPENRDVIDVGCDHALLDIYLASTRKGIHCTATDISASSIESAKETAKNAGVEDKVSFYVTDGLKDIPIKKEDVIVIAGMGAHTMLPIISSLNEFHTLILSAHKDTSLLRKELCTKGYKIKEETLVFEKHWYFILTFEKGQEKYDEIDYIIGPSARKNKEYINYLYKKESKISKQKSKKTDLLKIIEEEILPTFR
ncbi:MAG: class I SAM-dependent methyltransferase [Bacilli bacterium]|nr:class I SAM-dependent methyltransferase [Bacilli bacterium]